MSASQTLQVDSTVKLECAQACMWYAVQTRANHEKKVAAVLQQKGIEAFAPTAREVHRWSDRRAVVEVPLFPCYTFVHIEIASRARLSVLQTPGVFKFIGFNAGPIPVPDAEIESIQAVLANRVPASPCPYKIGEKVRIRGGALDGVTGVLVAHQGERRIVLSIELIRQSMSVVVEGYDLERV